MNIFSSVLFFFFCTVSTTTFAYTPKEGNVTAIFGPFFHKTNFQDKTSGALSPIQDGYGLIANGDANEHESLEIAMFFMPKIFMRSENGNYVTEETQLIHITMGYKRWVSEYLAFSLAFFSSYSLGEPKIVHSDFAKDKEPTTSARDTTEYGFDLAAQWELWSRDRLALVFDTRYSKSLTNKSGETADHYGVLLGLRYFIQAKQ